MKIGNVKIPRSMSRTVPCPECGAEENEKCFLSRERRDGRVYRDTVHEERVFALAENIKPGSTLEYLRKNL